MKSFQDKVVVITGAGSGIGRALATAFAEEGAHLALNDYNAATLEETRLLLTDKARIFTSVFDVAERTAMQNFASEVIAEFGQVDVVINNAGLTLGARKFHEVQLDEFERVMAINFNGVLYGCHAFIPHLLQASESALVNISSIFGLTGVVLLSPYSASKFAVHGLSQSLIHEYADTSLTVHSVHPGGINTNITRNTLDYDPAKEITYKELRHSPERAAKTIMRGIQKKKHRILIGEEAYLVDGFARQFPIFGGRIINNYLMKANKAAEAEQLKKSKMV